MTNNEVRGPMEISIYMVLRETGGKLELLVAERLEGSGKGKLTFPGGKIHDKEKPHHAAIRELKEETGIDIVRQLGGQNETFVGRYSYWFGGVYHDAEVYAVYCSEENQGTPFEQNEPKKLGPWRWITHRRMKEEVIKGRLPVELVFGEEKWGDIIGLWVAPLVDLESKNDKVMPYGVFESCILVLENRDYYRVLTDMLN